MELNLDDSSSEASSVGSDLMKDWKRVEKKLSATKKARKFLPLRLGACRKRGRRRRATVSPPTAGPASLVARAASSSSSGPTAAPAAQPPLERGSSGPTAAPAVQPRQLSGEAWGPFLLSEIKLGGCAVGWGATCAKHTNAHAPHQVCKRQFRFCGLSPESTKRLAMSWCVEGLMVADDDASGKDAHLGMHRGSIPMMSDGELELGLVRATERWGDRASR